MNIRLTRDLANAECTLGRMWVLGEVVLQAIERPWADNAKGVSCVPVGTYKLERHNTEAHPYSFALVNPALGVIHEFDPANPTARTACLIHVANKASELRGCIALGVTRAENSVLQSTIALKIFNLLVPWLDGHTLMIQ